MCSLSTSYQFYILNSLLILGRYHFSPTQVSQNHQMLIPATVKLTKITEHKERVFGKFNVKLINPFDERKASQVIANTTKAKNSRKDVRVRRVFSGSRRPFMSKIHSDTNICAQRVPESPSFKGAVLKNKLKKK